MELKSRDETEVERDVAHGAKLNLQDGFHGTEIERRMKSRGVQTEIDRIVDHRLHRSCKMESM